jgi:hypothetical protein
MLRLVATVGARSKTTNDKFAARHHCISTRAWLYTVFVRLSRLHAMAKRRKKGSRRAKSDDQEEMKAFLASEVIDQIVDYSRRGRAFERLSDAELLNIWRDIWDDLANDPLNESNRGRQADIAAEFSLRKSNPPYQIVKAQIKTFLEDSQKAWQKLVAEDPEAERRSNKNLERDIKTYRGRTKRSN